ncbi:NADPH:quinone reductase [Arachidicoccus rhizosphaerae]|uniref:NADPH:quinone reductase n=1 Tax=Arachidicoccus rhizosphaerae TaxID=551991 RepID=A0A1H3XAL2_9BACT|nr:zinc-binding alcohol dehydrogenase family protein [Arachidicoccus rhizosphaerae]SDZ96270.1 NADPH:quinone reductase [Arachidicoccus rhizosphaerae]
MKAIVMYPGGAAPEIGEREVPIENSDQQLFIKMRAAAIKNLDKMRASGKHYSSELRPEGQVVGTDGVGITKDGKRYYGFSQTGILAEYSLIDKAFAVPIPDGLDDSRAAAIPNAVMGSAMALLFRAKLRPGETVLINGATGVTGRMAIQVAKHYGAAKVIVTGRNKAAFAELEALGADQWLTLSEDQALLTSELAGLHQQYAIDIVLDYLWGASAEAILNGIKGKGGFAHGVRFVSIGGMTGDLISLSSSILRSTPIVLMGSGLGSWTKEEVGKHIKEILPEFFDLAAAGQLQIETKDYGVSQLAELWEAKLPSGVRAVIDLDGL